MSYFNFAVKKMVERIKTELHKRIIQLPVIYSIDIKKYLFHTILYFFMLHVLSLNDAAYFGENLYLYIFVFLSSIWSHGDHSSWLIWHTCEIFMDMLLPKIKCSA